MNCVEKNAIRKNRSPERRPIACF